MTSPRKPISSEKVQIFHRDALTTVLHRETWNVNLIEKQSTITKCEFESWNFITITIHLAVFFFFDFLSYCILRFRFLPIMREKKKSQKTIWQTGLPNTFWIFWWKIGSSKSFSKGKFFEVFYCHLIIGDFDYLHYFKTSSFSKAW